MKVKIPERKVILNVGVGIEADRPRRENIDITAPMTVIGIDTEADLLPSDPTEKKVVDTIGDEAQVKKESPITARNLNIPRDEVGVRVMTPRIVMSSKVNISTRKTNIRRKKLKAKKRTVRLNQVDYVLQLCSFSLLWCNKRTFDTFR